MRQIPDFRTKSKYEPAELITACIAMFIFKEGSRNAFNNDREEENFQNNYEKLFGMMLPHMDTVDSIMRCLDENELEKIKTGMVGKLLKKKSLHKFRFLNQWFTIAVDGSGVQSFSEKHCGHCLTRTSKNGKTTYFHNVSEAKLICSNGFSISSATEWIENPEGDFDKQDCEQKAFKRLAEKLKKMYPRLPICINADGLYPARPFFDICKKNGWTYIVTFKDGNLPSVWEKVILLQGITPDNTCRRTVKDKEHKINYEYIWINNIDYHGYEVNWIECLEYTEDNNKNEIKSRRFVYPAGIGITRENAPEVAQTGRLRWKIENEGFNIQKNQGYNMKHKYSRVSYTATKNYYQCLQIAHMINQLIELSSNCGKLIKRKITIRHLWKCMMGFFVYGTLNRAELKELSGIRTRFRFE